MKNRYLHFVLNLFSFTLLLVALYLNFVKKEPVETAIVPAAAPAEQLEEAKANAEADYYQTAVNLK